jgi:GxxExxY protein
MTDKMCDQIIEAAIEVHKRLGGPGLLETVYESALSHELALRGLQNERQKPIPVIYKSAAVREPLYLDILVDNKVIIEVKATGKDFPYYQVQLFTYLRLADIKTGLLINFGKQLVQHGICRIMNDQPSSLKT